MLRARLRSLVFISFVLRRDFLNRNLDILNSCWLQNVYLTFAIALLCCFGGFSAFLFSRDVACCGYLGLSCSIIVLSHGSASFGFMLCGVVFVDAFLCCGRVAVGLFGLQF